jgi:hypothetical protein
MDIKAEIVDDVIVGGTNDINVTDAEVVTPQAV